MEIYDIPEEWRMTIIGEICEKPQYGYTTSAIETGDIRLLRTTDITSGKINWDTVPYCFEKPKDLEKYLIREGDILISRAGSIGISYLIESPKESVFASYLIRFRTYIDKKFLKYFLNSPFYWDSISEKKSGIAVLNINANKLSEIKVCVPPLAEQKEIVSILEELFSNIDKGIENLNEAKEQLKIYRQSILKDAFEGKLTEEWRKKNTDKLESPKILLEKIQSAREGYYNKQIEEWEKEVKEWEESGKEGRKPSKPQKLSILNIDDILKDNGETVIPNNWIYIKSEYISDFITKGTTPKSDKLYSDEGEIPFLKVYNLTHTGKIDFSINPTFTDREIHRGFLKRSIVYPNDILMNIVGPPLGKVAIVPNTYEEWNINQAIVRFRPYENNNNKFLMYYLLFEKTIVSMTKQAKATAGQLNLTLEICRNVQVPYCTLEEQNQIVQEIESRFSICDTLEYTIGESLNKAELLKQSILKKAFNGELTKEWREKNRDLITGDNSAESLLKKIKEEKEKLLKDK